MRTWAVRGLMPLRAATARNSGPPHGVHVQAEILGDFLARRAAVELVGDGLGGDAADRRDAEPHQRVDQDRRSGVFVRAPGSWLVAGPVHPREELFAPGGQDDLPVGDRDQAELGVKLAAALQVDQQLAAGADVGAPVGERVGHLVLVAEPVDEVPQLSQPHVMLAPVGPQQARLDEFRPRDIARPGGLDPDHGPGSGAAVLSSHQCSVDGATRSRRAAAASVYISRSRMVTLGG